MKLCNVDREFKSSDEFDDMKVKYENVMQQQENILKEIDELRLTNQAMEKLVHDRDRQARGDRK